MSALYVRLMKRVPMSNLSAIGSKKLPAKDDWLGNFLAIHPSSCQKCIQMKSDLSFLVSYQVCDSSCYKKSKCHCVIVLYD